MALKVKFKKLHLEAQTPFKKHVGDAGYDLFAVSDCVLIPNIATQVPTGISLKLPETYYAELHTRSSHGLIGVRNHLGVIDSGFRGEITVIMNSPIDYFIKKGDRIAQLILKKRISAKFVEADENEEFTSDRGSAGFGSTGK
jgi:dUTP pyrophosphatase